MLDLVRVGVGIRVRARLRFRLRLGLVMLAVLDRVARELERWHTRQHVVGVEFAHARGCFVSHIALNLPGTPRALRDRVWGWAYGDARTLLAAWIVRAWLDARNRGLVYIHTNHTRV